MNLLPLLTDLSIATKRDGVVKWQPNWAQLDYIGKIEDNLRTGKPNRFIILKARQIGLSTATEGVFFIASMIWERWTGTVIAHDAESSQKLLKMTKLFWTSSQFAKIFHTRYAGQKHLEWIETDSSIEVKTAGNANAGRSNTLQGVHASEVGFWDNPDDTMLSLTQAVPYAPNTMFVLESTANGVGNYFWETWNAAVDKDVDFVPLFYPWWKHPEYSASYMGMDYSDFLKPGFKLDAEERVLRQLGVSDDKLAWRRWAIPNLGGSDLHKFHQEYPSSPEEAFVSTGTNVFSQSSLNLIYEPQPGYKGTLVRDGAAVRFVMDQDGEFTVFSAPSPDWEHGQYFVAGDPTHTTTHDWAVIQVINRRTWEQVAVWRGRIDAVSFAEELAKVGRFYNNAMVVTESTGPGYGTIGRLISMGYPLLWKNKFADKAPGQVSETYGWQTNMKRKEWMIGYLLKAVVDKSITIHHRTTYNEMLTYIRLPDGGYGPAQGEGKGHDDTVTSLAIACICNGTEERLPDYGSLTTDHHQQQNPDWGDE